MRRWLAEWTRSTGGAAGVAVLVLLCGSCGSTSNPADQEAPEAGQVLALTEAEGAMALDRKYATDPKSVVFGKDGKRSQFEGKKNIAFGGNWDGKEYAKKDYEKTWWGGKKKASTSQYVGNLDASRFRAESVMMGRSATQAGQRSRYDGKEAASAAYHTGRASETYAGDLSRPTDARTDWRRSVYPQPKIRGYKQQQQMDIEETRRLLGRD